MSRLRSGLNCTTALLLIPAGFWKQRLTMISQISVRVMLASVVRKKK